MINDGKYLEKIVYLLEKNLSPEDIVEHDVNLPVLTSSISRTRQCDIVIKKGKLPRQSIVIVEVQDRASKVDINTFNGWLGKLEEVGAQQLIVVSKQEFPDSIKEKVNQSGNKVFLMNIKSIIPEKIPNFFELKFFDKQFNVKKINYFHPSFLKKDADLLNISREKIYQKTTLNTKEKIWSIDGESLLSFNDVAMIIETEESEISLEGIRKIEVAAEDKKIYIFIEDKFLPFGLKCEYSYTYSVNEVPISLLSYEQVEDGTLAWLAEFNYQNKNLETNLKIPIIKKDNYYTIRPNSMEINSTNTFALSIDILKKERD